MKDLLLGIDIGTTGAKAAIFSLEGLSLLLGTMSATGASLRWYKNELAWHEILEAERTGCDPYNLMTREAAQSPVGSGGVVFLPYMMGERAPIWHTQARGVFFGLSLSIRRKDLVRSILEGTAFALLHNLEVAKSKGIEADELRSVGGGSKSPLWNQIGRCARYPRAPSKDVSRCGLR